MEIDEKTLVSLVKDVPNVLAQVYTDLAQPSVQAVGKALGAVFEFSTSFLLPVKLLNEKFRLNFEKRIEEYRKKLEAIPEEKRGEVHPQIGTPIVEKLSYTTTDEIADLYTSLLASASNKDTENLAHPAFISIIEKLSVDEARIINYLSTTDVIQYCQFRAYGKDSKGFSVIEPSKLTMLPERVTLTFPSNLMAYLNNLVSLGILEDMSGRYKIDRTETDKICALYKYDELVKTLVPVLYSKIDVVRSYFQKTYFGEQFITACKSNS